MATVWVNGKAHNIFDVHVKNVNGVSVATGRVHRQWVTLRYEGSASSEMGDTEAKPWLRQVRRDLVMKYLEDYNKPKNPYYNPDVVDDDFKERLRSAGFTFTRNGNVFITDGISVHIDNMTQRQACDAIEKAYEEGVKADRLKVDEFFERFGVA